MAKLASTGDLGRQAVEHTAVAERLSELAFRLNSLNYLSQEGDWDTVEDPLVKAILEGQIGLIAAQGKAAIDEAGKFLREVRDNNSLTDEERASLSGPVKIALLKYADFFKAKVQQHQLHQTLTSGGKMDSRRPWYSTYWANRSLAAPLKVFWDQGEYLAGDGGVRGLMEKYKQTEDEARSNYELALALEENNASVGEAFADSSIGRYIFARDSTAYAYADLLDNNALSWYQPGWGDRLGALAYDLLVIRGIVKAGGSVLSHYWPAANTVTVGGQTYNITSQGVRLGSVAGKGPEVAKLGLKLRGAIHLRSAVNGVIGLSEMPNGQYLYHTFRTAKNIGYISLFAGGLGSSLFGSPTHLTDPSSGRPLSDFLGRPVIGEKHGLSLYDYNPATGTIRSEAGEQYWGGFEWGARAWPVFSLSIPPQAFKGIPGLEQLARFNATTAGGRATKEGFVRKYFGGLLLPEIPSPVLIEYMAVTRAGGKASAWLAEGLNSLAGTKIISPDTARGIGSTASILLVPSRGNFKDPVPPKPKHDWYTHARTSPDDRGPGSAGARHWRPAPKRPTGPKRTIDPISSPERTPTTSLLLGHDERPLYNPPSGGNASYIERAAREFNASTTTTGRNPASPQSSKYIKGAARQFDARTPGHDGRPPYDPAAESAKSHGSGGSSSRPGFARSTHNPASGLQSPLAPHKSTPVGLMEPPTATRGSARISRPGVAPRDSVVGARPGVARVTPRPSRTSPKVVGVDAPWLQQGYTGPKPYPVSPSPAARAPYLNGTGPLDVSPVVRPVPSTSSPGTGAPVAKAPPVTLPAVAAKPTLTIPSIPAPTAMYVPPVSLETLPQKQDEQLFVPPSLKIAGYPSAHIPTIILDSDLSVPSLPQNVPYFSNIDVALPDVITPYRTVAVAPQNAADTAHRELDARHFEQDMPIVATTVSPPSFAASEPSFEPPATSDVAIGLAKPSKPIIPEVSSYEPAPQAVKEPLGQAAEPAPMPMDVAVGPPLESIPVSDTNLVETASLEIPLETGFSVPAAYQPRVTVEPQVVPREKLELAHLDTYPAPSAGIPSAPSDTYDLGALQPAPLNIELAPQVYATPTLGDIDLTAQPVISPAVATLDIEPEIKLSAPALAQAPQTLPDIVDRRDLTVPHREPVMSSLFLMYLLIALFLPIHS